MRLRAWLRVSGAVRVDALRTMAIVEWGGLELRESRLDEYRRGTVPGKLPGWGKVRCAGAPDKDEVGSAGWVG